MNKKICINCGKCLNKNTKLQLFHWTCSVCGRNFDGLCRPDFCSSCKASYTEMVRLTNTNHIKKK